MNDHNKTLKMLLAGFGLGVVITLSVITGAVADRASGFTFLDRLIKKTTSTTAISGSREVVSEESVVTKVVAEAEPSVVTISMTQTTSTNQLDWLNDFYNMWGMPGQSQQGTGTTESSQQDIGSGFVISNDGLIVTNKHVVADTTATYKVVTSKDEVLNVDNIYRDPITDLAILKVNKTGLTPVKLGDSNQLKVGQMAIAIGTALGEFRSTVTTGVISGLGRGIVAGSQFEGSEKLDNVIQTSAAINPGNSGGPLFNSSGEVIGVNVAVSQNAQNIGFALPINIVKDSINNFKTTGEFERPFLGVSYQMITKESALLNSVPQGAYVQDVVAGSPADKAGIKQGDIITQIDGKKMSDSEASNTSLATIINGKKIGDTVKITIYRDSKTTDVSVKLDQKR